MDESVEIGVGLSCYLTDGFVAASPLKVLYRIIYGPQVPKEKIDLFFSQTHFISPDQIGTTAGELEAPEPTQPDYSRQVHRQ